MSAAAGPVTRETGKALSIATRAAVVLLELEQDTFWPTFAEPPEAMLPLVKRLAGADNTVDA